MTKELMKLGLIEQVPAKYKIGGNIKACRNVRGYKYLKEKK